MNNYFSILVGLNVFFSLILLVRVLVFNTLPKELSLHRLIDIILMGLGCLLYSLYCGLRPYEVGTDTHMYTNIFNEYSVLDWDENPEMTRLETSFLFSLLIRVLSWSNVSFFFFIVSLMFNVFLTISIYKLFKNLKVEVLFAYFFSFYYYTFTLNGIRNGLAVGFVFLFLVLYRYRKGFCIKKMTLLGLGLLTHISVLIYPIAIFLTRFIRMNSTRGIILTGSIAVSSFLGLDIFFSLVDKLLSFGGGYTEHKLSYYLTTVNYDTGFRIDFVVMGIFFLVVSYFYKVVELKTDSFYNSIVSAYSIIICLHFLLFNMPANDRIGILGWVLSPILVFYPLDRVKNLHLWRVGFWAGLTLWMIISLPFVKKYNFIIA